MILQVLRNEVMCSIPFASFSHNDVYNIHSQFLAGLKKSLKKSKNQIPPSNTHTVTCGLNPHSLGSEYTELILD